MDPHPLFAAWAEDCAPVAADAVRSTFDELVTQYQSPGRFYHTLDHVADVLQAVRGLAENCRDLKAVRFAAWYHDAVYDPRANDNEERSADLARAALVRLSAPLDLIPHVSQLILATKTHLTDGDPDAAVLLDADLAVLGADAADYDRYAVTIRREYAWVLEADYRSGRARILQRFLDRPWIYQTATMRTAREDRARANLRREIARLTTPVA